jgi:hypothetical protein
MLYPLPPHVHLCLSMTCIFFKILLIGTLGGKQATFVDSQCQRQDLSRDEAKNKGVMKRKERDREAERQRNRETERQRDRETEKETGR